MDCQMPELDGYDATREIRRIEKLSSTARRMPIIALTANSLAGDREKCLQCGMDDYISKPVDVDRLKTVLRRWRPNAKVAASSAYLVAVQDDTQCVDLHSLQNNFGDDKDALKEYLEHYLKHTDAQLQKLESAIERADEAETAAVC